MRSWVARLRWLMRRPRPLLLLIAASIFWLAIARAAVLTLPHARLERWFGEPFDESGDTITDGQLEQARKVAWAIDLVSRHTPWTSNCLPQAMAARRLLRSRRIPTTIYIGAKFHETETKLVAHAWCRSGSFYVTGGKRSDEFGAVIAYGTAA